MIRPLKNHKYANARISENLDGSKVLTSYSTEVCGINADGSLWCNGLYSMTTRKHIGYFAKEFGYTYQDFKILVK